MRSGEEEKAHKIRVGDDFQAIIPELKPKTELREYDTIQWDRVEISVADNNE